MILQSLQAQGFTPMEDDYYDLYVGNYLVRVHMPDNGEIRVWLNEFNEVAIWSMSLLNVPFSVVDGTIKLAIRDAKSR